MNDSDFSRLLFMIEDGGDISKELVLSAFSSEDEDAMGLAYVAVTDEDKAARIRPHVTWEEVHDMLRTYYLRCIESDFHGQWADSRTSAVLDCQNWFKATVSSMLPIEQGEWNRWIDRVIEIDEGSGRRLRASFEESRVPRE